MRRQRPKLRPGPSLRRRAATTRDARVAGTAARVPMPPERTPHSRRRESSRRCTPRLRGPTFGRTRASERGRDTGDGTAPAAATPALEPTVPASPRSVMFRRVLIDGRMRIALILGTALLASFAQAQDTVGVIRGTVVSAEHGEPLSYATVTVDSTKAVVFADSSGVFRIGRVAPGGHHVRARDLGYAPADTMVEVGTGQTLDLKLVLP